MAFLGGLFGGGGKTVTSSTTSTATTVDNDITVQVAAEISPVVNTAVDLTGFSDAIGKVAGVLQTVADNATKVADNETKKDKEEKADLLGQLSKIGGAASAVLALLAVWFAFKNPESVKVQL